MYLQAAAKAVTTTEKVSLGFNLSPTMPKHLAR